MRTYIINNRLYKIKDFTFAEEKKAVEISVELFGKVAYPEKNKAKGKKDKPQEVTISPESARLIEILNFILVTENGETPAITKEDLENTKIHELSDILVAFYLREVEYQTEKKRKMLNLLTEYAMPKPNSRASKTSTPDTSNPT
jgi:hypothetical protein